MTEHRTPSLHVNQPLPSYLALLAERSASGVLAASSDDARREIVVVGGEVRAARSSLEDEKLGLWLVQRGRISEDDRALTLLSQGGSDAPPLGHLLVTRGCIAQEQLEKELQELALTIIKRAAAGPRTYCEFMEGRDADQPDTLPNLTTSQIVLESAREFPDLEAKRAAIGAMDQMAWPSGGLDTLLQDLVLTPTEAFLLSRMGSSHTLASLVKLSSLPEERAISTLYTLVLAGVVRLDAKPHPAPIDRSDLHGVPVVPAVDESRLTEGQIGERAEIRRMADEVTRIDHYTALGLRVGASPEDINATWERVQQRFSEDRVKEPHLADLGPQITAVLERAREAYDVLKSVRGRTRYDKILGTVEADRRALAGGRARTETDPGVRSEIVEANLKRADELIHDGELYPAIQLLEQACALEPRPQALLKLAKLLLRNPLWTNRALECMRRAIEVDPKFVEAWLELAEFWRRRNHTERQRKSLERALSVDPDNERANKLYTQLVGKRELDRLVRRARQSRRN